MSFLEIETNVFSLKTENQSQMKVRIPLRFNLGVTYSSMDKKFFKARQSAASINTYPRIGDSSLVKAGFLELTRQFLDHFTPLKNRSFERQLKEAWGFEIKHLRLNS